MANGGGGTGNSIPQIPTSCDATGESSVGCEFYSVPPRAAGGCFAAFIVNLQDKPVSIQVELEGKSLDVAAMARVPRGSGPTLTYEPLPNGQLPGKDVAIVFLAQYAGRLTCPVAPGHLPQEFFLPSDSAKGHAFRLTTSLPVTAYDISPYGGGTSEVTSATLLLPTSTWHTNYVAVDPTTNGTSALELVAQQDGTEISILPRTDIAAGPGVAGATKGIEATYQLNRGEVLQLLTADPSQELVGSSLVSNKPIGVWGGAGCFAVPEGAGACDSAHQQIPPVNALGHEYVAVRYRNRIEAKEEPFLLRVVGGVDGTILSYDPAPPVGAPTSLGSGEHVDFSASEPIVIRSQDASHPFYLASYMTGCTQVDLLNCTGDPEFVNVIPAEQYLSSYVFFTDPTYPDTNLVLVRSKHDGAFSDVVLDCTGNVSDWQPVGNGGKYEYARVDLVRGNFEAQGKCDNGRHELRSQAQLGLTVWGWGDKLTKPPTDAVSYAYPGGTGVSHINEVFVPTVVK